jgi:hypothetical protein
LSERTAGAGQKNRRDARYPQIPHISSFPV